MQKVLESYNMLSRMFEKNNFHLFLVGGSVRDYILNGTFDDIDMTTNAKPEEMREFLDGDYSFSKYGNVKIKLNSKTADITTFRKEKSYLDKRHPSSIRFVKSMRADSKRRDFTINALYMDRNYHIFDYHNGRLDIQRKLINTIGNPTRRIKEDPLRIIRAIRFSNDLGFTISRKLEDAIRKNSQLVFELNKNKIKEELKKFKNKDFDNIYKIFKKFNIHSLLNMLD